MLINFDRAANEDCKTFNAGVKNCENTKLPNSLGNDPNPLE
jgi:hypothetical protein